MARKVESSGRKVIDNFWSDMSLLKDVKLNEVFLRKMVSAYGEVPVIRAFMRPDMQHVWSTTYPGLTNKIEEEQKKLDATENIKPPELPTGNKHRQQEFGNKTLIGKLRELE